MKKIILSCFLLSIANIASALGLDAQRTIFSETIALQEQELWDKANVNINQIKDYPLVYLAEYNYLNANLDKVSDKQVLTFIKTHQTKIVSDNLQRSYLFYLASQKNWTQFLTAYPSMPNNAVLKCHYLQASIATGQSDKAWPDAQKYWLSSTSLPNACDDVYVFYQNDKKLTQDDIWKRFQLAYVKNKQGLMRFLMAKMDKSSASTAALLYELEKDPKAITDTVLFSSRNVKSFSFLVPTLQRLAKIDFDLAMEMYEEFNKKIPFNADETKRIKTQFATVIVQRNKSKYFKWLDKELGPLENVSLIEQRIRYAIKRNDWKNIEFWVSQLPTAERHSSEWKYWQARVLENAGKNAEAKKLYQEVSKNRNFHGFMASQKLGVEVSLNNEEIKDEQSTIGALDSELTVIRELLFHESYKDAKFQWYRLLNSQSVAKQQQLGLYAYQHDWPYLAVLASISSKSWNALAIRFPDAKQELFVDAAKKFDIEETYVYAITRRESSFDEHAKSPVGASGYMQLMPKTAAATAKKIGLTEYTNIDQLDQGEINVQLGAGYFNQLLTRYDGNRVLATAAYNAGPHRVDRWSKKSDEAGIALDSWVDTIPFYETRAYVQNVLAYNVIYQHVLGKPMVFLKDKELKASY